MYKLLLCLKYLRTRFIALASIISVTLGVATLIVVNSVMAGFTNEMQKRIHGILSDVVIEGYGLSGFQNADDVVARIHEIGGDRVAGVTTTAHVPAMLNFQFRGQWVTRQVNLIGIDEATYADVSDFGEFLLHEENRRRISFALREGGYDDRLPKETGWERRRRYALLQAAYEEEMRRIEEARTPRQFSATYPHPNPLPEREGTRRLTEEVHVPPPVFDEPNSQEPPAGAARDLAATSQAAVTDPFATARPAGPPPLAGESGQTGHRFHPGEEQFTGIILGIGLALVRRPTEEGKSEDFFLCAPGDDVKITVPTDGAPPQPVSENFTVVDFYESKMSEYDSTFAFVPLARLQEMRGMIDPLTGERAVTSIQIRLEPGADVAGFRDELQAAFPSAQYPYRIQTWKDMQGPLLAAVQLETTVLNILLFLIIAVAGFGILATFYMIVVEKTKDIGILKSLGAPSEGVMSIFLTYGLALGALGSGVGLVAGVLFVRHINEVAYGLEMITGHEVFDPNIYYFREIPTILDPLTLAWIVAGAMAIAVLASVLPALRAARLHPVEALRYE